MATIPAGTAADVDAAVAAAKAAFAAWSATPVEERAKYLHPHRRGARRPHGRDRHDHLPGDGHGQVAVAARAGRPADQQLQPGRGAGRELPVRGDGRQLAGRARADRRRRLHHAVELPAAPDRRQGRLRDGRRLHRGAQAERGRPARRVHPGRDHRRGRPARRRVQPRHRRRPGRRRGDRRPPRRRHGVVHRLDPRRQARRRSSAPRRSSRSRSSSAASRPTCCSTTSTTPTSPRPCADGVGKAFLNSGQTCSALTRMLVPRERLAEAEQIAADGRRRRSSVGDPFDDGVHARPAGLGRAARPRAGLHPEGHRRGRHARRRRRRRARGPRHRLLRASRRCSPTSPRT